MKQVLQNRKTGRPFVGEVPVPALQRGRVLVRTVAATKWGDEGYYRLAAVTSSEVEAARGAFGRAQSILATR